MVDQRGAEPAAAKKRGIVSRLAQPVFMLVLTVLLLPDAIRDGGWRVWVAPVAGVYVLWLFASEVRAIVRERRRP
ncbi:hypothetical protein [Actinoplanes regularis]|uniref:hypothetical protein n=1 Tax=Actinoplanes regularis TaxID=52697 RepID=UPI00249FB27B|nr:hypothetical protein [Actinoplanes regularis]GLW31021.1 hypothetical protein Areg01_39610 [Actinoplanes regularis]